VSCELLTSDISPLFDAFFPNDNKNDSQEFEREEHLGYAMPNRPSYRNQDFEDFSENKDEDLKDKPAEDKQEQQEKHEEKNVEEDETNKTQPTTEEVKHEEKKDEDTKHESTS